ncbi:protein of unknown function [uncultured Woeseiaceae bacterium]|uniref:Uncharacterized protein n=1 Tax=uncultured Woeseiaceae bacterium TaxID=1983305 RepID=A0A7D9D3F3_9GAMM|nr:protein of unknown function [uncultured Woeseiaceae bacterium]
MLEQNTKDHIFAGSEFGRQRRFRAAKVTTQCAFRVKKIHFVRCALIFSGIFNVARKMLITKDQSAIRYGFSIGRWADWVVINPHPPPQGNAANEADWPV